MAKVALQLVQIRLFRLRVGVIDNVLDRGNFGQDVGQGLDQAGVEEDGGALGLLKRVLQALLTQGIVGSDDGDGLRGGAVRHGQPVCTRRAIQVDATVLLETELAQTSAELETELLVLEEGLVGVPAHLKVGPLLVDLLLDAIDDLLDLLVLDVGLDQLPAADSLRIAEQAGRAAEVIVGGRDVLGRAQDETVLRRRVSAGDGLALDGLVARRLDREGALLDHARLDVEVALRHLGDRWLSLEVEGEGERNRSRLGGKAEGKIPLVDGVTLALEAAAGAEKKE